MTTGAFRACKFMVVCPVVVESVAVTGVRHHAKCLSNGLQGLCCHRCGLPSLLIPRLPSTPTLLPADRMSWTTSTVRCSVAALRARVCSVMTTEWHFHRQVLLLRTPIDGWRTRILTRRSRGLMRRWRARHRTWAPAPTGELLVRAPRLLGTRPCPAREIVSLLSVRLSEPRFAHGLTRCDAASCHDPTGGHSIFVLSTGLRFFEFAGLQLREGWHAVPIG